MKDHLPLKGTLRWAPCYRSVAKGVCQGNLLQDVVQSLEWLGLRSGHSLSGALLHYAALRSLVQTMVCLATLFPVTFRVWYQEGQNTTREWFGVCFCGSLLMKPQRFWTNPSVRQLIYDVDNGVRPCRNTQRPFPRPAAKWMALWNAIHKVQSDEP